MAVRWNTYKVSQAVDLIEEHILNCNAPLDLAKEETIKALEIPNLPGYMESRLRGLADEFGYTRSRLQTKIDYIRTDIPKDELAKDKAIVEQGTTSSLI